MSKAIDRGQADSPASLARKGAPIAIFFGIFALLGIANGLWMLLARDTDAAA